MIRTAVNAVVTWTIKAMKALSFYSFGVNPILFQRIWSGSTVS